MQLGALTQVMGEFSPSGLCLRLSETSAFLLTCNRLILASSGFLVKLVLCKSFQKLSKVVKDRN